MTQPRAPRTRYLDGVAPETPRLEDGTPTRDAGAITVSWLVRLRWWALAGQIATIATTVLALDIPLRLAPLAAITSVTALSNLWLASREGRVPPGRVPAVLAFDTLALTGLLYFTGGPSNPFSALYLVHVTLAAVVAGMRGTGALVALSATSYAVLFFAHVPVPALAHVHHQPGGRPSPHLLGMWVAFTVTAALIAYFVTHLAQELRARETRLAEAERLAARNQRLASLTTLAAGAAHELGTPLGTIAVASKELERALTLAGAPEAHVEDARLIRAEAARCRDVLQQMSGRTGAVAGELPARARAADVFADLAARLGARERERLSFATSDAGDAAVFVPRNGLAQALETLVRNALDAEARRITLSVEPDAATLRLVVEDDGQGMSGAVLERLGEQFFTTKAPGAGMGLGVFLARSFAEAWGGRLSFSSEVGAGSRAVLELPTARGDAVKPTPDAASPLASRPARPAPRGSGSEQRHV